MTLTQRSKTLAWLLRHGASQEGLAMDAAGWSAVADVLALTGLSRPELERVVAENTKSRYQLDGERVRASQGHSLAGTPVTLEGLEASWAVVDDDASVWHGTRPEVELLQAIARDGLLPIERTHVHLAEGAESVVGKRSNVGVLLEVSPPALRASGHTLFRSPNGVLLARRVPPTCVVGLRTLTKRARKAADALRGALGLDPAGTGD